MREVLAELFQSKKFLAMVGGVLTTLIVRAAGKAGLVLDPETAKQAADAVALLVASYCLGQGLADHGKSAAEISAAASSLPAPAPSVTKIIATLPTTETKS